MAVTDLIRTWWTKYWELKKDSPEEFLILANNRYNESQQRMIDHPNIMDRTKIKIIDELRPLAEERLKEINDE